ncbi:polysaccharide pyruvyl transferase family protein [Weissella cibaria]|uniref:polysaccharide pyruvyl transferase family protein n=1 Tax=Weissella cibaria TaxID=137591 RepID=UPI00223AB41E|nr:polysaccharide pyruvyl transferase family protein [Weissella cibaria]MCT0021408.1 hypothetical protein [Weissella cibaria]
MNSKIRLFQWGAIEYPLNFGDLISKIIIENIVDCETVVVDRKNAELLAVGSILNDFDKKFPNAKLIWGSGFIDYGPEYITDLNIAAVRGKLSAKRLKFNGPMGDPGLLVSKYFEKEKKVLGRIGIVPHFLDKNSDRLSKYKNNEKYFVIDVERNPVDVIKDITTCEIVYSSSMHGLIVSDSFDIPNYYIEFSERTHGTDFKFQDYYSVLDRNFEDAKITGFFDEEYANSYNRITEWVGEANNIEEIQARLIHALRSTFSIVCEEDGQEILTDLEGLYGNEYDGRDVKVFSQYRPFRSCKEYGEFKKYIGTKGYIEVYQNPIYTLFRTKSLSNPLISKKLMVEEFAEDYGGRVQRKLARLIAKIAYVK